MTSDLISRTINNLNDLALVCESMNQGQVDSIQAIVKDWLASEWRITTPLDCRLVAQALRSEADALEAYGTSLKVVQNPNSQAE